MSLESAWGQADYVARQLAVHGRLVEPAEMVAQLEAVTLDAGPRGRREDARRRRARARRSACRRCARRDASRRSSPSPGPITAWSIRAMAASSSATAATASSAPSRRRCGRRPRPTGTRTASSSPARTRKAAAAGSSPGRCRARAGTLGWEEVRFRAQCTPFRHLAFFPDMAPQWAWMRERLGEGSGGAQPVRLYRRRHAGAGGEGRAAHPCRRLEEIGRGGQGQCRALRHGRPADPLAGRRRRQVRRARGAARPAL